MKPTKKLLPPVGITTEASPYSHRNGTPGRNAVRAGQLQSAEALRRKAYLRLARLIGVSPSKIRRAALIY